MRHASTLLQRLLHVLAPADVFLGELFRQPWLLFIVILIITLIQFRGQKRWVNYA